MKYTYNFFKEGMPEWKRKKDPINSRYCIRPLSFWGAAFCANHGISANAVSYFSLFVALCSCGLYFFNSFKLRVFGAFLMNIWLWLDCIDGNLARSVKKQPFGEFADALSSYTLVAFMGIAFGYAVYSDGGVLFNPGNPWAIVIGGLSSSFDTLLRLTYQKYKNTENELISKKIICEEVDDHKDHSKVGSFKVWFEAAWGIGGWLPHFILLATIFRALDLILIYCLLYFGVSYLGGSYIYIKRAIKRADGISFHESDE